MQLNISPLIDDKNPFYCPAIPASAYLKSIRGRARNFQRSSQYFPNVSQSFTTNLDDSLNEDTLGNSAGDVGSDWILGGYLTSGRGWFSSPRDELPPYSPTESLRTRSAEQLLSLYQERKGIHAAPPLPVGQPGTKRKSSFSDFGAPPKYARSVQSVHDSSFEIELQHERLHYSSADSSPGKGGAFLAAFEEPEDDMDLLINKLDRALPGIRLKSRLGEFRNDKPQALMDFLGHHGYVNRASLEILSRTTITGINFAPSMFEENGLNMISHEIYSVLSKDGNFNSLTEISFSGVNIRDTDIRYIQHLQKLSVLLLDDSGITNEAVFLLVSLKDSLSRLSLARNIDINDDAVPALIILYNLNFLSIVDTNIGMAGLRRIAEAIHRYDRLMDIEIPFACEDYIDNINEKYLFNPVGPLVTDPGACGELSTAALRRNLEAHAACNPDILTSGSVQEMVHRLSEILQTRRQDILVVSMLKTRSS